MKERFYKIGEVSEILGIEQHTLRYLENTLRLKIKRDERGDRFYSERDLDTLRLVIQLKEKGLNTTAIKMALENVEEGESGIIPSRPEASLELTEVLSITARIMEQNQALLEQNKKMEERMERMEKKIDQRNLERERKIDEFLDLWKSEQVKNKGWFSKFRGK